MPEDKLPFGEYIKQLRNKKKEQDETFSLRGVADKIGMSPTYLSKIERGMLPASAEATRKLAEVLGVPVDDLFAHADKIDPELEKEIANHDEPVKLATFMRHATKLPPELIETASALIEALEKNSPKKAGEES